MTRTRDEVRDPLSYELWIFGFTSHFDDESDNESRSKLFEVCAL
jgi:hypothetical protein